jgi:hypothetical protein
VQDAQLAAVLKPTQISVANFPFSCSLKTNLNFFFVVKGPAADATDAQQPRGLLCNPVMKMISFFFHFSK